MPKISWRVHSTWFLTVCLMALFPLLQGSSMAQTPQSGSKAEAQHPEDLSNWLGFLAAAEGAGA